MVYQPMLQQHNENKVQLQPAFVLHSRPFKETSLLVDLITLDHGRVRVVAKGAKSKKSKLKGILQPTLKLLVSWQGKGALKTLTLAEMLDVPSVFDGEKMISIAYINELILKLTPSFDSVDGLFDIYEMVINGLQQETPIEPILRVFEKSFLSCLGYELLLEVESESFVPINPQASYVYVLEHGPRKLAPQSSDSHSVSGATLLALANNVFVNNQQLREAKCLLRINLDHLLGGVVLKSRVLMKSFLEKKRKHLVVTKDL